MRRRDFFRFGATVAKAGLGHLGLSRLGVGAGLGSLWSCRETQHAASRHPYAFGGSIVGSSHHIGHLMREASNLPMGRDQSRDVLVVGAGISGLAAVHRLQKKGVEDFLIVDMASQAGGNAASGSHAAGSYPWGAHYVPIASPESVEVAELFSEFGVIQGWDAGNRPRYNEEYLCHDPAERLFLKGEWQDGLIPERGLVGKDREDIQRFLSYVEELKTKKGRDGRRLFAIPMELSSQDAEWTGLDGVSIRQWLRTEGFSSATLVEYVNYCCRDDYGLDVDGVSAWAGLHYFAARGGQAANADSDAVLTWPEGNAWLANRLKRPLGDRLRLNTLTLQITTTRSGVEAILLDVAKGERYRLQAKRAIYAGPRFTLDYVVPQAREKGLSAQGFEYKPWMVANLTLHSLPDPGRIPLSWDNVIFGGKGLGYISADHQRLQRPFGPSIWTYYRPLSEGPAKDMRRMSLEKPWRAWVDEILGDMKVAHPNLQERIAHLDVWLWGHGMIAPTPGFLFGEARQKAARQSLEHLYFAHSDQSGFSLFEEALFRGYRAADRLAAEWVRA